MHLQREQLHAQLPGRRRVVVKLGVPIGRPSIEEEGHAGESRHGLGEQLEPFPGEIRDHDAQPRDVPPAAPGWRLTRPPGSN